MNNEAGPVTDRELGLVLKLVQQGYDSLSLQMREGLGQISDHLASLNGKAAMNAGNIAVLRADLHSACGRIEDVETTVHRIDTDGCAPGRSLHEAVARTREEMVALVNGDTVRPPGRFRVTKREIAIGGGAIGVGAVLLKLLEVASDWLHHVLGWGT